MLVSPKHSEWKQFHNIYIYSDNKAIDIANINEWYVFESRRLHRVGTSWYWWRDLLKPIDIFQYIDDKVSIPIIVFNRWGYFR
jgi:Mlc titration factor MtfA (ptsG expression regulator)